MIKFEKVSKFKDVDFNLPVRKTKYSAGYDMEIAEDITIPPVGDLFDKFPIINDHPMTLNEIAAITKANNIKPTLASTGVRCLLDKDCYLELMLRSSTPMKYWLVMSNSEGIIDADYANNPDNEGEIFFQLLNLSPYPITLHKHDIIGQGIIKKYITTDDDAADGKRTGGFGSTTKEGE